MSGVFEDIDNMKEEDGELYYERPIKKVNISSQVRKAEVLGANNKQEALGIVGRYKQYQERRLQKKAIREEKRAEHYRKLNANLNRIDKARAEQNKYKKNYNRVYPQPNFLQINTKAVNHTSNPVNHLFGSPKSGGSSILGVVNNDVFGNPFGGSEPRKKIGNGKKGKKKNYKIINLRV